MSNTLVDVFDETIATFFTRMYIYIYIRLTRLDVFTRRYRDTQTLIGDCRPANLLIIDHVEFSASQLRSHLIVVYRLMTKPNNTRSRY